MTEITTTNIAFFGSEAVSFWQGIRPLDDKNFIIVGTLDPNTGIVYIGPLDGSSNSVYEVNFPDATSTSVYGPDDAGDGTIQLVGSYKNGTETVNGFLYQGTVQQLTNPAFYRTVSYDGSKFNYLHSVAKDCLVGNFDNPAEHGQFDLPLGPGQAFVYNIENQTFDLIKFPESITNTAYGIWYNGDHKYTICGGYANEPISIDSIYDNESRPRPVGLGYVVDYNAKSRKFSKWTSFTYPKENVVTHFQGISSVPDTDGKYYQLIADSLTVDREPEAATEVAWLKIKRKDDKFKPEKWIKIVYPEDVQTITGNSVAGNAVVGIVVQEGTVPYQAQLIGV